MGDIKKLQNELIYLGSKVDGNRLLYGKLSNFFEKYGRRSHYVNFILGNWCDEGDENILLQPEQIEELASRFTWRIIEGGRGSVYQHFTEDRFPEFIKDKDDRISEEKPKYDEKNYIQYVLLSSIHYEGNDPFNGLELANATLYPYPDGYYHIGGKNPFLKSYPWPSENDKIEWENALNDNYGSVLSIRIGIDLNNSDDISEYEVEYRIDREFNKALNVLHIIADPYLSYSDVVWDKRYDKPPTGFNKRILTGEMLSSQKIFPTIYSESRFTKGYAPWMREKPGILIRGEDNPIHINREVETTIKDNGFLDNINYHYAQERDSGGYHEISSNIISAIEDYNQAGLIYNERSLYKYLIAFENAILGEKLAGKWNNRVSEKELEKIVEYSNNLMGGYWSNILTNTDELKDLNKYYVSLRHGNKLDIRRIKDKDVIIAKKLAHSAIVAITHISRENNWQHWEDSKDWIKEL